VRNSFEREFKNCDKRIIVATFASNVHRIQEIINVAVRSGRKVAVSGRSMENILKVGAELGYITPPPGTLVDLKEIHKYSNDRLVIITTGSQGEPMSALYRMAYSNHRQVQVGYGDKILIAASPIPGNEKPVYGMINELIRKGAEVVYERLADMHVSGHACQEEIKLILALTRPKYYMPVHGEYRHLKMNAGLGLACGVESNNIFISDIGKVLELSAQGAEFNGTVPSGRVLVDGYGVGDVGAAVLRERKSLSESGVITAVAVVDIKNGLILSNPEIISRGFIFVREAEELMEEMRLIARETLEACLDKRMTSRNAIKEAISRKLSDYLFRKTKREPLIVPILIEM
jgi:ribonuclease J